MATNINTCTIRHILPLHLQIHTKLHRLPRPIEHLGDVPLHLLPPVHQLAEGGVVVAGDAADLAAVQNTSTALA